MRGPSAAAVAEGSVCVTELAKGAEVIRGFGLAAMATKGKTLWVGQRDEPVSEYAVAEDCAGSADGESHAPDPFSPDLNRREPPPAGLSLTMITPRAAGKALIVSPIRSRRASKPRLGSPLPGCRS